MWRLDDDRRSRSPCDEGFERIAGEREAECVANGRADIRDGVPGRRRLQDDRIVVGRHDDESRPGKQRDPSHFEDRFRSGAENGRIGSARIGAGR